MLPSSCSPAFASLYQYQFVFGSPIYPSANLAGLAVIESPTTTYLGSPLIVVGVTGDGGDTVTGSEPFVSASPSRLAISRDTIVEPISDSSSANAVWFSVPSTARSSTTHTVLTESGSSVYAPPAPVNVSPGSAVPSIDGCFFTSKSLGALTVTDSESVVS